MYTTYILIKHVLYIVYTSCFWCAGYLVEYPGLRPRPCPLHAGADAPVLQGGGALKSTQKAAHKWRVCAELATNWRREAVNSTNGKRDLSTFSTCVYKLNNSESERRHLIRLTC